MKHALDWPARTRARMALAQVVRLLEPRVRRLVKSPYAIGGLVVGAAAATYFAVTRMSKPLSHHALRKDLLA